MVGPDPGASPRRIEPALIVAVGLVGVALGGLLIGYAPLGGDPDRLYKPLKAILAASLRSGTLPFWTDRLGLGIPLVAESHVAAFYPPNWVAYRLLDVTTSYRVEMWLHFVALAATTYLYARRLALAPEGAALASVSFSLCGFLAIHCTHEPFYHATPYLPLALWLAEGYLARGSRRDLAGLAIVIGVQLLVGHFQVQFWTSALVLFTGLWRVVVDRRPPRRLAGLALAVGWGATIAACQLVPTADFARFVGQTSRPIAELMFYGLPPAHLAELVLPRFFRSLPGGPEDLYWVRLITTGAEACFYVGTVPLILAVVGLLAPRRGPVGPWFVLLPASVALATMTYWAPSTYRAILGIPGFGLFRCPARYTLIASLGLAILAGRGLDRGVARLRFGLGIGLAIVVGLGLAFGAIARAAGPEYRSTLGDATLDVRVGLAGLAWALGLVALLTWRAGRAGAWLPLLATAIELGLLFYTTSHEWGWPIDLPASSPILSDLAGRPGVGRLAGRLDDLPIRAGLTPALPYLGFRLPLPHRFLEEQQRVAAELGSAAALRWLRRFGVTHAIWPTPVVARPEVRVRNEADPGLDRLAYLGRSRLARQTWRVATLPDPLPDARLATRSRVVADQPALIEGKGPSTDEAEAWYILGDEPPPAKSPPARSSRVVSWDGRAGVVEHDGAVDLVLARTFDPGWRARLDDDRDVPIAPVDGGLQSIRIDGAGSTRVAVRYEPRGLRAAIVASLAATLAALFVLVRPRPPAPAAAGPPEGTLA